MDENTKTKLGAYIENGTIFQGKVKLIKQDEELGEEVLVLDIQNINAVIPKSKIDVFEISRPLISFVGATVNFKIVEIREDGTVICSRKEIREEKRNELIKRLENGEEFDGKITKLLKYGAYLDICGFQVILKNVDFASDYTTVAEKHAVGDVIRVKLNKINSKNKIQVEAVEKFFVPSAIKYEDFEVGRIVYGKIRSIKPEAVFVGLIPNLDALASIPDFIDFPLEEGMSVVLKITKVIPEKQRVRGKIIRVFPNEGDLITD